MRITGNRALSGGDLKALMNTRASAWYAFLPGFSPNRFSQATFQQDLHRILTRYRNIGYFDAAVDTTVESTGDAVRIRLAIREGDVVRVSAVSVIGLGDVAGVDSARIVGHLISRPGRPLKKQGLEQDRDMILSRLLNSGYAFATVSADLEVDREALQAQVHYRAVPGPRCTVGGIRVEGNREVAGAAVRSGLTFHREQLFSKRELLSSQKLLYRSGAFRSVLLGLPDSARRASPVEVVVSVAERKPRSLKLGGGYGTEEHFRASLSLQHRNFLGNAEQLSLDAAASALEANATVNLTRPYVWGSRTWLSLAGFVDQSRPEEVRVKRLGGSSTVERYLRDTGKLTFSVRFDLVDFQTDSTNTSFLMAFLQDARDDLFNPRRGYLVNLEVKESGFLFQSDNEFLKTTLEYRGYKRIPWRGVTAVRLSGGTIRRLRSATEVPNFERYFAGGANSVRGWSLNRLGPKNSQDIPVGGLSLFEASIELRHRLIGSFGTAAFLDAGRVGSRRWDAFRPGRLAWSAGVGARYLTAIGPVRFDIARRLSNDPGEARTQLYVSLGQAF